MQTPGFPSPEAALLAIGTCLADLSMPSNTVPPVDMEANLFFGNEGDGGILDCCPEPILRIEAGGELPAEGVPMTVSKHGCVQFVENIVVTFLTCWKTSRKDGTRITDPADLAYGRLIMQKRWEAIQMLRCCGDARIKYVGSTPIKSDGVCAGFEIRLLAPIDLCGPCAPPPSL